jgi:YfiH family protein
MTADWISAEWPAPPNVRAFSTTRTGGVSKGPWAGLNLGLRCGDETESVRRNQALLNRALPSSACWPHQVHGTDVARYCGDSGFKIEADAVISFSAGEVCAVLTADCLPVFFCNTTGDRVGIAHAGWRGLAAGVLQSTIMALDETPANLVAWLGPAIGPQVYEVGPDVAEAFPSEFTEGFVAHGDRFLMDIYSIARIKLRESGVAAVHGGGLCTFSDPTRFYSYRRDGVTGRMAHIIWLAE